MMLHLPRWLAYAPDRPNQWPRGAVLWLQVAGRKPLAHLPWWRRHLLHLPAVRVRLWPRPFRTRAYSNRRWETMQATRPFDVYSDAVVGGAPEPATHHACSRPVAGGGEASHGGGPQSGGVARVHGGYKRGG